LRSIDLQRGPLETRTRRSKGAPLQPEFRAALKADPQFPVARTKLNRVEGESGCAEDRADRVSENLLVERRETVLDVPIHADSSKCCKLPDELYGYPSGRLARHFSASDPAGIRCSMCMPPQPSSTPTSPFVAPRIAVTFDDSIGSSSLIHRNEDEPHVTRRRNERSRWDPMDLRPESALECQSKKRAGRVAVQIGLAKRQPPRDCDGDCRCASLPGLTHGLNGLRQGNKINLCTTPECGRGAARPP